MKPFDYYRDLPDVMRPTEVTAEFEAILSNPNFPCFPQEAAAVLGELSERQWNTYTLLDTGVRGAVESLLEKIWRDDDAVLAESLFAVAGRLGLPSFLSFVGQRRVAQMSSAVQAVVAECVAELQESIADPYSGLR
jgi:hypothetical protein